MELRHTIRRTAGLGLVAAWSLSFALAASAQEPGPDAFTIDDAINLESVSGPRLSPDGSRVLFTRRTLDWDENERSSRIWIADADGSDARPYTAEDDDQDPRWSPDGRWIAFLRRVGEGSERTRQLFLLRTDGGEARQLTKHPTSVQSYDWTPDAGRIVFVAADSLSTEEKKERENGADAVFVDEGPNGQEGGEWSNLWSVEADPESATPVAITEGQRRIGEFRISPDGSRIAFTYRTENHRNDRFRSEIALVDLEEGGDVRDLTENNAPESGLRWAPDGRTLAFTAPDLEEWELRQGNLYGLDVETGEIRELAPGFERDIRGYEWAPDGRHIDMVALERTDASFFRLDLETGDVRRVGEDAGIVSSASFSSAHDRVAFVHSTPDGPGDVWVRDFPEGEPVRVTDVNPWVRERALAQPELVRWRSEDGLEIEGILYVPPDRDGRPGPLVLRIHGGPAGVFTRGFDADAQILTAYGYAVLQPNVRGSTGYGDELLRGNMYDIGGGDYYDLMTGVDAMLDRGIAHSDSLGVRGWSYGGILGGWTITRTDRFRAASLGAMVADWRSEFGAGFHHDVVRWYIGGDPWSEHDAWLERSAYSYVDRITTPTILFHGDNDRTDTVQQSLNFHAGLRLHGVPTRFLRFPREGHGIQEPRHRRTLLVEEVRWFERWVRGNEDWEAPERPEEVPAIATDSDGGAEGS